MNGTISTISITGTIEPSQTINATIGAALELGGKLSFADAIFLTSPHYTGAYEVVPSEEYQVLNTNEKVMDDDVTVHPVPLYRVSNEFGTTLTIG